MLLKNTKFIFMKSLNDLKEIYEKSLKKFGDNHQSVGWKNKNEALLRYKVMTDLFKNDYSKKTILEVGCGLSHYFLFLKKKRIHNFRYIGLDVSEQMINLSKKKYPDNILIKDIGSGINMNRRGLRKIIYLAIEGKIKQLVIVHKDRLTRFGFDLIQDLIKKYSKGNIIILDKKKIKNQKKN